MSFVYWRFTNNCNLQCTHCVFDSRPGAPTVSIADADAIIDNFGTVKHLMLSGGEPFVAMSTLEHILKRVGEQKKRLGLQQVTVQTDGYWLTNPATALRLMTRLGSYGVSDIEIMSDNIYHVEQGLDVEAIRRVRDGFLAVHVDNVPRLWMPVCSTEANPFGRAKETGAKPYEKKTCSIRGDHAIRGNYDAHINPSGDVYPCCWEITPSLGNVIREPLNAILGRASKSPVFQTLITHGPQPLRAASPFPILDSNNDCVTCVDYFAHHRPQDPWAAEPELVSQIESR